MDKDLKLTSGKAPEGIILEKYEANPKTNSKPYRQPKYNRVAVDVLVCLKCGSQDQLRVVSSGDSKYVFCRKCIEQQANNIRRQSGIPNIVG